MDRALLVGINAYPTSPLQGCVNDVNDIAAILKRRYSFSDANITLLTDEKATKSNIVTALQTLIDDAVAGDRLLFHYSGHGTEMPVSGRTIADSICPVDFDFTLDHAITARDFAAIFSAIPEGVIFDWLSDSCFSGNLTRVAFPPGAASRHMVPPPHIQEQIDQILKLPQVRVFTFENSSPLHGGFISGCGAKETSADGRFVVDGRTRYNGAFTHFVLQELDKQITAPLTTLCHSVTSDLHSNGYLQTPVVKGETSITSQPLLGGPISRLVSDFAESSLRLRFPSFALTRH